MLGRNSKKLKEDLFYLFLTLSSLNSQLGTCQDRREEIKIKYTINTEGGSGMWNTVSRLIKH